MDITDEREDNNVIDLKKVQKLEILKQREIQRKTKVQDDKSKLRDNKCETENVAYILSKFENARLDIQSVMQKIENCLDKTEQLQMLHECYDKLDDLHKLITGSVYFVGNFHIRKFHECYRRLDENCQQLEQRIRPRTKFRFAGRNSNNNNNVKQSPIQNGVNYDGDKITLSNADKITMSNGNKITMSNGDKANGVDTVDNRITTKKHFLLEEVNSIGFRDRKLEKLRMDPEQVDSKDVQLTKLEYCQVKIYGCPATLYVTSLEHCEIFCGPTFASVFIESCRNCTFVIACQQLRIHSAVDCKFYTYITCRTILENCKQILFAPYAWKYERIADHFDRVFRDRPNNWNLIDDFDWLSNEVPSPNWSFIDENDRISYPID